MQGFRRLMLASAVAATVSLPAQAFDLNSMAEEADKAMDKASESANDSVDKANQASGGALDQTSKAANDTLDQANAKADATRQQALGQLEPAGEAKTLVDNLSSQLGVSGEQAAGGAGAMLALAKNQLSGEQFSAITDKVPGLPSLLGGGGDGQQGGLAKTMLGKVTNLDGVKNAFGAVGLSPEMVGQFASPMLDFLGNQGVGGTVLNSLKGLWGAAA